MFGVAMVLSVGGLIALALLRPEAEGPQFGLFLAALAMGFGVYVSTPEEG